MSYFKTAAVATLVAVSAFGASMGAANAHGKKHFGIGFGHPHFYNYGGSTIWLGSTGYSCKHWLKKYKKTGNPFFLDRYYACRY